MMKAVIFDLDHTLYDRDGTYENMGDSFCHVFKEFIHKDKTKEELVRILQQSDREGAYLDGWKSIFRKVCELGAFEHEPPFRAFYDYIYEWFPKCIKASEHTYDIFRWCKELGYVTGIITNGSAQLQKRKIEGLELEQHVEHILICGEIGHQKPSLEPFRVMSSKLQLKPEEMIYVGDNPINDVDASRRAGYTPIWIRSVGTWPDGLEQAGYAVDQLDELPEMLTEIKNKSL